MTSNTCMVIDCYRPKYAIEYTDYCRMHKERVVNNGHPLFKPPAFNRQYERYDRSLGLAYRTTKGWYEQVDLKHYKASFRRLIDRALGLPDKSPYRRLTDLKIESQLLYLLKSMVERIGIDTTMQHWIAVYLAAQQNQQLFPNIKTFAAFVIKKGFGRHTALPTHITKSGRKHHYRINAKRAMDFMDILSPILDKATFDLSLWQKMYDFRMRCSNSHLDRVERVRANQPDFYHEQSKQRKLEHIYQQLNTGI